MKAFNLPAGFLRRSATQKREFVVYLTFPLPFQVVYTIKCAMTPYQNSIYDWVKSTGTIRIDPMARQVGSSCPPPDQPPAFPTATTAVPHCQDFRVSGLGTGAADCQLKTV